MYRKSLLFQLFVIAYFISAFVPDDKNIDLILQKFEKWKSAYPQEKVYLHLSKNLFLTGDTLYCKAYVVNAEKNVPSGISNIVYAEILDENSKVVTTMRFSIFDGIGWSSLPINSQLPAGNYIVRAYTNWMKNFDHSFFFTTPFAVMNIANKTNASKNKKEYSFTFFPEGGQLVAGLPSRLAFKSMKNGFGTNASGTIVDEKNNAVLSFSTGFAGMGSCVFTPDPFRNFKARIQYEDGFEEVISLPKAQEKGYVLTIDNSAKKDVTLSVYGKNVPENVTVIGVSNGKIQYSENVNLVNGKFSATISKKKFPTGIAQFTLFDKSAMPAAERLVFINHNDALNVDVKTEKQSYGKREKVSLTIHVADELDMPVIGSFSVSVTDGNTVPAGSVQEHNITTNLLLTSDLKGRIENPVYYFTNIDSNKIKDLDNLLLTQGWRRFAWKEIITEQLPLLTYAPETSLSVSGKVLSAGGKPVEDAKVTLLSKNGSNLLLATATNEKGAFTFDSLAITAEQEFVVKATTASGSDKLTVVIDTFAASKINKMLFDFYKRTADSSIKDYTSQNMQRWQEKKKAGLMPDDPTMLKNVTVTSTRITKVQEAVAPSYNLNGPGNADQVLTYDDLVNCHVLSTCLPGKMIGVIFKSFIEKGIPVTRAYSGNGGFDKPMMLMIDGVKPILNSVDEIPAHDIQSIEVLRSGGYLNVYGTSGSGGVLVITTKKGGIDYNHLEDEKKINGVLFTKLPGYTVYREFYSPDYGSSATSSTLPDLRSTIYWKPDIVTDDDGNATLEWYNADVTGTYNVVIEGISTEGKTGVATFSYQVK